MKEKLAIGLLHIAPAILQQLSSRDATEDTVCVKKKLKDAGWTPKPMSGQQKKSNRAVKRKLQESKVTGADTSDPIKGVTFVLHGAVPANNKKNDSS